MRRHTPVLMLLAGLLCLVASAQTPEAVPTQDPGVARAVLMDRAEVRILRVEIQPGAGRRVHTHDDVRFHVRGTTASTGNIPSSSQQKRRTAEAKFGSKFPVFQACVSARGSFSAVTAYGITRRPACLRNSKISSDLRSSKKRSTVASISASVSSDELAKYRFYGTVALPQERPTL